MAGHPCGSPVRIPKSLDNPIRLARRQPLPSEYLLQRQARILLDNLGQEVVDLLDPIVDVLGIVRPIFDLPTVLFIIVGRLEARKAADACPALHPGEMQGSLLNQPIRALRQPAFGYLTTRCQHKVHTACEGNVVWRRIIKDGQANGKHSAGGDI